MVFSLTSKKDEEDWKKGKTFDYVFSFLCIKNEVEVLLFSGKILCVNAAWRIENDALQ